MPNEQFGAMDTKLIDGIQLGVEHSVSFANQHAQEAILKLGALTQGENGMFKQLPSDIATGELSGELNLAIESLAPINEKFGNVVEMQRVRTILEDNPDILSAVVAVAAEAVKHSKDKGPTSSLARVISAFVALRSGDWSDVNLDAISGMDKLGVKTLESVLKEV